MQKYENPNFIIIIILYVVYYNTLKQIENIYIGTTFHLPSWDLGESSSKQNRDLC